MAVHLGIKARSLCLKQPKVSYSSSARSSRLWTPWVEALSFFR